MKKILAVCLAVLLCLQLFGCGTAAPEVEVVVGAGTQNLMAKIVPAAVEPMAPDQVYEAAAANFALELLKESYGEVGVTLSPYSLYLLMAMVANGADKETLQQMEQAMGLPSAELNRYLYSLQQDERQELLLANSIWFQNSLGVKQSFLQTNGDYFGAEIFGTDFNEQTVTEINAWVAEHTKDRITELVKELDPTDCMVLLNALCFDGQWAEAFEPENSFDGSFTAFDGTVQTARMMQGAAEKYIQTENAAGFVKEYENGYSFLALLPEADLSMEDFLSKLDGAEFLRLWRSARVTDTAVTMPRLELNSSFSPMEALTHMGMGSLFSENADLGRISDAPLFVSEVNHSCSISIDESGTKAAAASSAEITYKGVPKSITLDRPFVMAILDNETGTILFLGVVASVE